jgi:predicted dehydrogenase
MDEVRWGMIGCGDVTERKSGPAFSQVAHSRLAAVMSRSPDKAEDYARRHAVPAWYSDADQLINDPQINAVYIATPPDSHLEYTLRAARAGKAVYVEKPMARTHSECQQMVSACREAGVPLFVAYYRRRLPAFLKVKELVESGVIGDVRFISLRLYHPSHPDDFDPQNLPWRVRPEVSGGGYFYDLASHQFDYLDYLFGPVVSTVSQTANRAGLYAPEDTLAASWVHESGLLGSGTWCFVVAPEQHSDYAEIVGSKGRVTFSFFDQIPVCLETASQTEQFSFPRQEPIQQSLVQTIVAELRGEGQCSSTGESGARTNWVMEQITRR